MNQKNPEKNDTLFSRARLEACCRKAASITSAVFLHPMMLLSLGNNALAYGEASPAGQIVSIATTGLIAASIIRNEITDKNPSMPYSALAAGNWATAISIIATGHGTHSNWFGMAASAACLTTWGIAHVWRSILRNRKYNGLSDKPQNLAENPIFYTGLADIVACFKTNALVPFSLPLALMTGYGVALSISTRKPVYKPRTIREFLRKHITPSRVLGLSYAAMSAILVATHQPHYWIEATGLWFAGFTRFDERENRTLIRDTKLLITRQPKALSA